MGKNEFMDLFAQLAELEVLKYLASFPYWARASAFLSPVPQIWARMGRYILGNSLPMCI